MFFETLDQAIELFAHFTDSGAYEKAKRVAIAAKTATTNESYRLN